MANLPTPSQPVSPGVDFPHSPDERQATNPSGNPLPDTPSALNPSREMLQGGGDEFQDTSGDNRMVSENGEDYDALSDTGPRRQGNAYGVSSDAAKNFRDDARNRAELLRRQADEADAEAEKWDAQVDEKDQETDPLTPTDETQE